VAEMYHEGEVLAGKYRVEKLLGQGGMGVVVGARHVELQERVAVKLMFADESDEDAMRRFVREARAAARLESNHVVRVADVGSLGDGRAYLVMEYLDGQDLSQVIAVRGRLPASEAVDYVLQACEAIAEAHSLGIVHRDIKPSNLFLSRRRDRTPHIKVLDFGISKMATPSIARIPITATSTLMGSPLYMSPEQLTSTKYVDARSDIWAIGVVLYELLAAQSPFNGETLPQVCAMVMQEPPIPLQQVAPGLPAGLAQVVLGCLEKRPEARFQNLADLAAALAPFASPLGKASVERIQRVLGVSVVMPVAADLLGLRPEPAPAPNPAAATTHSSLRRANWGKSASPGVKSRAPFPLGGVALLLAVAGGGFFLQRMQRAGRVAAAAPSASPLSAAPVVPVTPAPDVAVAEPVETVAPVEGAAPVEAAAPVETAAPAITSATVEAPKPLVAKPVAAALPTRKPVVVAPPVAKPAEPTVVPGDRPRSRF
jgi:serine/threonine protein kinase